MSSATAAPKAPAGAPAPNGFLSSKEMPAAWNNAIATFPKSLPEGVVWPEQAPAYLVAENEVYEQGYAEGTVVFYWTCAWEDVYLDGVAADDKLAQEAALDALLDYQSIPIVKSAFPDAQSWLDTVVAPARGGNAEGIASDFSFGCAGLYDGEGK